MLPFSLPQSKGEKHEFAWGKLVCQSTECISELLRKALLPVENKPPPLQITEQMLFDFD